MGLLYRGPTVFTLSKHSRQWTKARGLINLQTFSFSVFRDDGGFDVLHDLLRAGYLSRGGGYRPDWC